MMKGVKTEKERHRVGDEERRFHASSPSTSGKTNEKPSYIQTRQQSVQPCTLRFFVLTICARGRVYSQSSPLSFFGTIVPDSRLRYELLVKTILGYNCWIPLESLASLTLLRSHSRSLDVKITKEAIC